MSQWNAVTFACMCKRHIKLTQAQQELFFPNMRFFWEHNCRIRMLQILPSGIWCKTNLSSHLPFPCYQVPKPLQGIMTFGLFVKSFLRGLKWTWESPPQKPSASFQPSQSSFSIFLFLMGLVYLHSFNFFQLYCLKIVWYLHQKQLMGLIFFSYHRFSNILVSIEAHWWKCYK